LRATDTFIHTVEVTLFLSGIATAFLIAYVFVRRACVLAEIPEYSLTYTFLKGLLGFAEATTLAIYLVKLRKGGD